MKLVRREFAHEGRERYFPGYQAGASLKRVLSGEMG